MHNTFFELYSISNQIQLSFQLPLQLRDPLGAVKEATWVSMYWSYRARWLVGWLSVLYWNGVLSCDFQLWHHMCVCLRQHIAMIDCNFVVRRKLAVASVRQCLVRLPAHLLACAHTLINSKCSVPLCTCRLDTYCHRSPINCTRINPGGWNTSNIVDMLCVEREKAMQRAAASRGVHWLQWKMLPSGCGAEKGFYEFRRHSGD